MPQINFTDLAIKKLKPTDSGQVDYFDSKTPGFGIRVSYGGSKSWFVKYTFKGRQRRKKLGTYPTISLKDAKKAALNVQHSIQFKHEDPASQLSSTPSTLTLKELIDVYIDQHAKVKKRSWQEDHRILNRYFANWHGRDATEIEKRELVELLQRIKTDNGPQMANRCLACIRTVFNFGIRNGYVEINPAHLVSMPAKETARDRVYSDEEIRKLWQAFGRTGLPGIIFKLCLATGQRLGEVAGMRWSEIENNLWSLPGSRTKNGRAHVVPLNGVALAELSTIPKLHDTWVFPSPKGLNQALLIGSKQRNPIKQLSDVSDFRPHDLRRTVQTNITKLGFSRFIADRLLNHVESGVGSVYDRHDYLEEKRKAAKAWGKKLAEIIIDQ